MSKITQSILLILSSPCLYSISYTMKWWDINPYTIMVRDGMGQQIQEPVGLGAKEKQLCLFHTCYGARATLLIFGVIRFCIRTRRPAHFLNPLPSSIHLWNFSISLDLNSYLIMVVKGLPCFLVLWDIVCWLSRYVITVIMPAIFQTSSWVRALIELLSYFRRR